MNLALYYHMAEVVPLACRKAADAALDPQARGFALLAVGRLGKRTDLPVVEKAFADMRRFHPTNYTSPDGKQREVETLVSDTAVAAGLRLCGQHPADFGFPLLKMYKERGPDTLVKYHLLGFFDPESRRAAHRKAREWLDRQPRPGPGPEGPKADPEALVKQLGHPRYEKREEAARQLRALGVRARAALLAGSDALDLEVARRCRVLVDGLRKEEVRLAFLKTAGDDAPARALLAVVLQDSHLAGVLGEAVQHPGRSGRLYASELWRLWKRGRFPPRNPKEEDVAPPAADVAVCFFLGSHPSSANSLKTEPEPPQATAGERTHETLLLSSPLRVALQDPRRRPPFARLLAGWLAARADPPVISFTLATAREYRLPEVLPVARATARNAAAGPRLRAQAILALADLGGKAELRELESLANETGSCATFRVGPHDPREFTAEVRDVAVGAALLLCEQDPAEFGFEAFRELAGPRRTLREQLRASSFAFATAAAREAAHGRADKWLAKQR
jgi:hypothetical protein